MEGNNVKRTMFLAGTLLFSHYIVTLFETACVVDGEVVFQTP
jgi:hypothetical protein